MKLIPAIFAALLLSGCATPTTGVIPTGTGHYTIANQGEGFWVTTNELKSAVLAEGGRYCDSKGKTMQAINVKEIPAGAFGRWPEAELVFSCQ